MPYKITDRIILLTLLTTLLFVSSCGPVHRFTRVKKTPREYSLNYCGGDIKAPKTDLNKEPWIVYSDREKNQTYNNAGGKVKAKDVDYLDAFLVIGTKSKGEYLKLIKYTPDILKNGKLDYKKAEYYGWMHKSKLLLNQQSVTDINSGKKNKMLAVFADTLYINEPEKYFAADSLKLYKDLDQKSQAGTISPYSIIYQLKQSADGTTTLVAKKPYIKAETVK
ncbi:MAG: type VI secretion system protein TssR domain-containing protein, partial [Bacteroides xylanisolvens]